MRMLHKARLRRLTSFSLRSALVAVTIFGIWLGFHMRSVKRQRASVEAVQRNGGWAYYDYEVGADYKVDPNPNSPIPAWLLKTFGRDHFHDVVYVNMVYDDNGGKRLDNHNRSSGVLQHLAGFPILEILLLHETQATDEGLRHVGSLTSLRRLYMWDARRISDEGVAHLSGLSKLEYLHLSNGVITDESLRILARLPKLDGLSLQGNRFTDQGLVYVQDTMQLRQLVLGGGENDITDNGLVHLRHLTHLEKLCLQNSQVTEDGLRHLVGLKNLKDLWLGRSQVRDASWLQQQLPKCKISL